MQSKYFYKHEPRIFLKKREKYKKIKNYEITKIEKLIIIYSWPVKGLKISFFV